MSEACSSHLYLCHLLLLQINPFYHDCSCSLNAHQRRLDHLREIVKQDKQQLFEIKKMKETLLKKVWFHVNHVCYTHVHVM